MLKLKSCSHFLTGEELKHDELLGLLSFADDLKRERGAQRTRVELQGKILALLFEKPSLRTHLSFSVAMQEAGGRIVETFSVLRKKEEPKDIARVISGYADAAMVRTHEHAVLEEMAQYSRVPIINGLSDSHHPCQVLADLLTLQQEFGKLQGLTLTYVGDGNNILHSLLLLLPFLGIHVRYATPAGYEPNAFIVKKALARAKEGGGSIRGLVDAQEAALNANALYTDVWTSMGFEGEEEAREAAFSGFQLNEELLGKAAPHALVMHCMPMIRGKEISEGVVEHQGSVLFKQSENRLHVQKALLMGMLGGVS